MTIQHRTIDLRHGQALERGQPASQIASILVSHGGRHRIAYRELRRNEIIVRLFVNDTKCFMRPEPRMTRKGSRGASS
jgi:hypothetical protein